MRLTFLVVHKRRCNVVAEDFALEDCVFELGKALARGTIDLEFYLKVRLCINASRDLNGAWAGSDAHRVPFRSVANACDSTTTILRSRTVSKASIDAIVNISLGLAAVSHFYSINDKLTSNAPSEPPLAAAREREREMDIEQYTCIISISLSRYRSLTSRYAIGSKRSYWLEAGASSSKISGYW